MIYEMKLNKEPFEMIESGRKTIEMRLDYESRKNIKIGDEIIFESRENGKKLKSRVINLYRFKSFKDLYENLPLLKCGYTKENIDTASYRDMEKYYSIEKQKLYGVVGIEIELI